MCWLKKIPFTIASKEILMNKFNQGSKRPVLGKLYDIEEDTNKWKHILCSWIGRNNFVKISMLPSAICRLNEFPSKYQRHSSQN